MNASRSRTVAPPIVENVVIRASAGTGKTFQLSNRFIALACAGQPVEQILAVTFARKAAGEIVDRILLRVAEAALDPSKARELAQCVGAPSFDSSAWRAQLKRLVQRLSRLRIGTLDSFFVQWASHFSLELGLPPGWRIIDELSEAAVRSEAIRTVLERHKAIEMVALLQLLSKGEVRRSVTDEISETVIQLYSLYRETAPEAWRSLPRPRRLKPEELNAAIVALAQVELPEHKTWVAKRDADVEFARIENWQAFICDGIANKIICGETTYCRKPIEPPVVAAYQPLIDQARAVLVGQLADQTEGTWKLLDDFHQAYEQLKLERAGWRFDDINHKLALALAEGKLSDSSYRLDARLGHLLLDEFQDTSRAQWEVMRPLAEGVVSDEAGSFLCVGDVKQAIYAWRGGLSEIFDTVTRQLDGLSQSSLKQSFRSSQAVIDTVNTVFANLAKNEALNDDQHPDRYARVRDNWSESYETHTTARRELKGHCQLSVAPRG
ncbi:MAG TPA: UvrD-helicase domain-containing protein, partial [Pirellulales bacterium]|nr:UvrD-helicase domain-containing protein [Pirellulales bacterium]